MRTIVGHPQASINTYIYTSSGRRAAVLTSKQFIVNRLMDGQLHAVNEFTNHMSRSGFRSRISELESSGFVVYRYLGNNGAIEAIQLGGTSLIPTTFNVN